MRVSARTGYVCGWMCATCSSLWIHLQRDEMCDVRVLELKGDGALSDFNIKSKSFHAGDGSLVCLWNHQHFQSLSNVWNYSMKNCMLLINCWMKLKFKKPAVSVPLTV